MFRRRKIPQVLLGSLVLSAAFYTAIPDLILIFGLDVFAIVVYGAILAVQTAGYLLGFPSFESDNPRPPRLNDYAILFGTIFLLGTGLTAQAIYNSVSYPDVALSSFVQGPANFISRVPLNGYVLSQSRTGNGSFSYVSTYSGNMTLDFTFYNLDGFTPDSVSYSYSLAGGPPVSGSVNISERVSNAYIGPVQIRTGQTLMGNYSIAKGPINPVYVWMDARSCAQTIPISFVLTNSGTARGSVKVEVLMDGTLAPNNFISGGWAGAQEPLPAPSQPVVFSFSLPPGGVYRANESMGVSDCVTHQFTAIITLQVKQG